jgi:hypothetical protein
MGAPGGMMGMPPGGMMGMPPGGMMGMPPGGMMGGPPGGMMAAMAGMHDNMSRMMADSMGRAEEMHRRMGGMGHGHVAEPPPATSAPAAYPDSSPSSAPPASYPGGSVPSYPGGSAPSYPGGSAPSYPGGSAPSYPGGSAPSYPGGSAPSYPGGSEDHGHHHGHHHHEEHHSSGKDRSKQMHDWSWALQTTKREDKISKLRSIVHEGGPFTAKECRSLLSGPVISTDHMVEGGCILYSHCSNQNKFKDDALFGMFMEQKNDIIRRLGL